MKTTLSSVGFLFIVLFVYVPVLAQEETDSETEPLKILNGEPRLIVVNGYSTSFQWPAVLQEKLDRYFDGESPVEVVPATAGGTPIARWMNAETGEPLRPWEKVEQALAEKGDRPAVVLAQQSLQWAYGQDRTRGISGPEDDEMIQTGADVIGRYVDLLHKSGADHVIVAMHIYKHPMEPKIGNERLALARYAETEPDRFDVGPDVWTPTKEIYPWGFAGDGVHPGSGGIAAMAHHWFDALCRREGIETPAWSEAEMNEALENARTTPERIPNRRRP